MKDPGNINAGFQSKMIQICDQDILYYSYTEIPVVCVKDRTEYNIITDAYMQINVGQDIKDRMYMMQDEPILYVTFGNNGDLSSMEPDPKEGSAMCAFGMELGVQSAFQNAQQSCYSYGAGRRPTWVYGSLIKPCVTVSLIIPVKLCNVPCVIELGYKNI